MREHLAKYRIGQVGKNKYGSLMEVIEYIGSQDIWVRFLEYGNLEHTSWDAFIKGRVKNPYDKSVFGVGYIGEGNNCQDSFQYKVWHGMLQRVYDNKIHMKHPTYKNCTICPEWHNFQYFCNWYNENYYEVNDERMHLDKDILIKGNKTYSPDTCIFVPQRINLLFVKNDAIRGELPIGVCFHKIANKYVAQCKMGDGKMDYLGCFDDYLEAFQAYKIHKEKLIKDIAEIYKDNIPNKLYKAMMSYIVEITD